MAAPSRLSPRRSARALAMVLASGFLLVGGNGPATSPVRMPDSAPRPSPLGRIQQSAQRLQLSSTYLVEQITARCMESRGFQYIPVDWTPLMRGALAYRLPQETFKGQYGYGVSTRIGHDADFQAPHVVDPNGAIRAKLSSGELRSYHIALYGSDDDSIAVVERDSGEVHRVFPRSCVYIANSVVYGPQVDRVRAWVTLKPLLSLLQRQIDSDPRVRSASLAWSDCMSVHGYQFADPDASPPFLWSQLNGIRTPLVGSKPSRELRRLQDLELTLAEDDESCRLGSGLDAVTSAVRWTDQTRFIAEHQSLVQAVWPVARRCVSMGGCWTAAGLAEADGSR